MFNIFYFLSLLCLLEAYKPRFCTNCKYFIQNKDDNLFSKCSKFPRERDTKIKYLVIGDKQNINYNYCSTARMFNHMCGEEGKKYKKKR